MSLSRREFLRVLGMSALAGSLASRGGRTASPTISAAQQGEGMMTGFPYLETKEFIAFMADNSARGPHRAGYNGIAALIPKTLGNNIFVPYFSGLNYETIELTGLPPYQNETRNTPFEPRREPMHLTQTDRTHVVLIQPETSHGHVSARITFRVEEPHYLHQQIELTFHRRFCTEGEKNEFRSLWASYLHMPPDRHVYMKNDPFSDDEIAGWFGHTRASHDSSEAQFGLLPERELSATEHLEAMQNQSLLTALQLQGRGKPYQWPLYPKLQFYYGLYYDLLFLTLFKQPGRFAFAYSPCGGGTEPAWNPAWDFVLVLDDPILGQPYTWDLCLVVKPFQGRREVLREVRQYLG